jgi:oligopeptide/dipeptide ABC transporter ATP-binding protein
MSDDYLEACAVKKYFRVKAHGGDRIGTVKAVDGVTLTIDPGETVGLVGESGCGKTTVSRLLLLLDVPTEGSLRFMGKEVAEFRKQDFKEFRRTIQPVFQNPYASLDPRMRVKSIVSEPLRVSSSLSRAEIAERVSEALETVGLQADDAAKHPHEFSGGQRQRIAIARALASEPRIIILDEAVSSQDISIRAQILNLLKDLQQETGLGYLFIAHDLATVRYISNRVNVMYLGRIVESATSDDLYDDPLHPYTKALLAACLPEDAVDGSAVDDLSAEPASPLDPPTGCHFHPRCPHARPECRQVVPPLREVAPGRWVACVLHD